MSIYWETFSWEAFAGLSAVVGAVLVGYRQSEISRRQAQILERQVRLQELDLRSQLFERRFEVYTATEAYLVHAIRLFDPPNTGIENTFAEGRKRANFLFGADTQIKLKEIAITANLLKSAVSQSKTTNYSDARPDWDTSQREQRCLEILAQYFENLPDVFGEEMGLMRLA